MISDGENCQIQVRFDDTFVKSCKSQIKENNLLILLQKSTDVDQQLTVDSRHKKVHH